MNFPAPKPLFLFAFLGLVTACAPPSETPNAPALNLEPCHLEGLDETLRCGTLSVAENPAEPEGRQIEINVVVLPALGEDPAPDPLFYFAGGPGAAAAANPGYQAWLFAPLRQRRDVVLVDQRGTGKSHPLKCQTPGSPDDLQGYFEPFLPAGEVEACRERLGEIAELELYTTPIAMDDVDAVREALGYEKVNVVGESYGTRAAQVYMRRHPDRVRSALLMGTAAMNQYLPLYHARDAQRALDELFEACAEDEACAAAFPDLPGDLETLMARLADAPAEVTLPDPTHGGEVTVLVGREAIAEGLRFFLYSPNAAVFLPQALHLAAEGELDILARLIMITQADVRRLVSFGMHLSVVCAEDRPFYQPGFPSLYADTFLGDYRVRQIVDGCEVWPRGEIGESYHDPVTVPVPTLLISGRLDPVTPPSWAEEVSAALNESLHVVVAEGHHGFGGLSNMDCYLDLMARFVEAGSVEGLETSCVETMHRGAFVTNPAELEEHVKRIEAQFWKS